MLIGLGEGLILIDFVIFWSKVKVTMVTFCPFPSELFITVLLYVLIVLSKDKTPVDFGFTSNNVNTVSAQILRTVYHKAFIFYMLIVKRKQLSFYVMVV